MKKSICALLIIIIPGLCYSAEIMTSARQIGVGRVSAVAYYAHSEQKIDFERRSDVSLVSDALIGKVTVKVYENWHVFFKAGTIGSDLEYGSFKYKKDNEFDGALFGGGVKYNLFPDTVVTPAISIDIGVTHFTTDLKRLESPSFIGEQKINHEIESLEWQGVFYISKKFFALEPYGGVKLIINDLKWKDNNPDATETIDGDNQGVSPFLGVRFNFLPLIGLTIEGSLVAEKALSVGLTIGF
ncbi:MAG: hypothetical protein ABII27_02175 [bacterium]